MNWPPETLGDWLRLALVVAVGSFMWGFGWAAATDLFNRWQR